MAADEETDSGGRVDEVDDESLRDGEAPPPPEKPKLAVRDLVNRATVRSVFALALGILIVATPGRQLDSADVVGIALIGSALAEVVSRRRGRRQRKAWITMTMFVVQLAAGIGLLVSPTAGGRLIGVVTGVILAASGVFAFFRGLRRDGDRVERSYRGLTGAFRIVLGVLVAVWGELLIQGVVLGIGVWWIAQGVLAVVAVVAPEKVSREGETPDDLDPGATWSLMMAWLANIERSDEGRRQLSEKIFYEGENRDTRLRRFSALMFFATCIATFGLISNSTAVVIGAMLVAPLMTPIMGLAAALILGWPRRGVSSVLVTLLGIAIALVISFILAAWVVQVPDSVLQNSQITSRTSPTLIDLGIALAAGGAGAFALSRPDVSDSLPGAAVAIALVPPLAVVGITAAAGSWSDVVGASLLFTTNLVGIILAGSAVFVVVGIAPLARLRQQDRLIKTSFAGVGIGLLIIIVPLAVTGENIASNQYAQNEAQSVVTEWLGDSPLELNQIDVDGAKIEVSLIGTAEPPSVDDLAKDLSEELDEPTKVTLRLVPEREMSASSD